MINQRSVLLGLSIFLIGASQAMALELKSPVFSAGQEIPSRYTCDGPDVSPELMWEKSPEGTKSFALICDDPDAPMGIWVHWVVYNIPAQVQGLSEGVLRQACLADGSCQGLTDFKRIGYGGPCPPPGKPHRYFFKLYALDTLLDIKAKVTKETLLSEMKGHILAEASLMGMYER